jgi:hypothetical protein
MDFSGRDENVNAASTVGAEGHDGHDIFPKNTSDTISRGMALLGMRIRDAHPLCRARLRRNMQTRVDRRLSYECSIKPRINDGACPGLHCQRKRQHAGLRSVLSYFRTSLRRASNTLVDVHEQFVEVVRDVSREVAKRSHPSQLPVRFFGRHPSPDFAMPEGDAFGLATIASKP